MTGKPAPTAPPAKGMIGPFDQQTAAELGGGALALLVLGGGALALSRRRNKREQEAEWHEEAIADEPRDPLFDEPMFQHEPAAMEQQPAAAQPSAFAWGNQPQSQQEQADGRLPGESWMERARRGPTPDNPSASLRNRLKRAAFFDKREREVAAGKAEPVEPDAGLPEAATEELETA